jgi:hypothetical protein
MSGLLSSGRRLVENRDVGRHGFAIDRLTQAWVRATGRVVDLDQDSWLDGPIGDPRRVAHDWLPREARRLGARECEGGGLVASFDLLSCEGFDPSRLAPQIVEFYEHTADWRLDVWSQWCTVARPGGWLISALFAKRLQQLALPLRPLDAAQGMDSRVVSLQDDHGIQHGAAWLRTLRSTGQVAYSGFYSTTRLPGCPHTSIRVAFPLPNGSITVFLRPSVGPDGALVLTSPIAAHGADGAYLIVRNDTQAWVRRAPLAEQFRVYVDDEGTLRTDHALSLWTIPILRLHYRLTPSS